MDELTITIIVVGGSRSGVGKTHIASLLVRCLPAWGALKVTVCADDCPRDKRCKVCANLETQFAIISNSQVLNQPNTDTARLITAGATKVLWLQARLEALGEGLDCALKQFQGYPGIVIEGTSTLRHLNADLAIVIIDPMHAIKPIVFDILPRVHLILNSSPDAELPPRIVHHLGISRVMKLVEVEQLLYNSPPLRSLDDLKAVLNVP
ncbi:MAG TPA: hypothetical protein EYP10_05810 [Armatimonadetes bacterium]|nr:hypothetical protein [Armatimonadota bacterium]